MRLLMLTIVIVSIPGLAAVMAAPQEERTQSGDEIAIRTVVEQYFHGIIAYDEDALRAVFHPEANVMGVNETGDADWSLFDDWVTYTRGDAPDPSGRDNRILDIDIAGPAAVVKTELDWPNLRYYDYLSLLKIDGEWKIVNKIWSRERPDSRPET